MIFEDNDREVAGLSNNLI